MVVSNMTLVKIGAIGGLATVTMGMLFRGKIHSNIKQTDFYKDALKSLRTHRGAVHLLGEPIKDRNIDIGNESINFTKENHAQYMVPVRGPKQKGVLYFWAERNNDGKWNVNKIELEVSSDPEKRLLIK